MKITFPIVIRGMQVIRTFWNWRKRKPAANQAVDLRFIPVRLLGAALQALPDARLTNHSQRKIVKVPGIGPVRLNFEWTRGMLENSQPYWRFSHAETMPVDLFETSVVDEIELKLP